jgi:hypothetical protein
VGTGSNKEKRVPIYDSIPNTIICNPNHPNLPSPSNRIQAAMTAECSGECKLIMHGYIDRRVFGIFRKRKDMRSLFVVFTEKFKRSLHFSACKKTWNGLS